METHVAALQSAFSSHNLAVESLLNVARCGRWMKRDRGDLVVHWCALAMLAKDVKRRRNDWVAVQ